MRYLKLFKLPTTLLVIAIFLAQFLAAPLAHAYTQQDLQGIVTNTPYYNSQFVCNGASQPANSTGGLKAGDSVYIVGDSITARAGQAYKTYFSDRKITANISAMVSRSWKQAGQNDNLNVGSQGSGKDAVTADAEIIKSSSAIIVALGTNGYEAGNPFNEIVSTIRAVNANAPIWWVNIANASATGGGVPAFNTNLDKAAADNKFTVINWSKVVDPSGDGTHNPAGVLDPLDNIHPTVPTGVNQLVDLVTGALQSGTGVSNTTGGGSCQCTVTQASNTVGVVPANGENAERAFRYFLSLGYSKEQAAGVIGNMKAESGVEPQIEQGKTPQDSRDINTFLASGDSRRIDRNAPGYGVVQWTGYGQLDKMADWARAHGKDPGSLDGQLSYIGDELQTSLKSVGEALKTAQTVSDAAIVWNTQFEHSRDSEQPNSDGWRLRIQYANEMLAKYGNATAGTSVDACGAGVVAGDIVKTALNLAWHTKQAEGKINKEDATPAYQDAMPKYNGSVGEDPFSDCGVFVATVVVASGGDPDYAKRVTGTQLDYVKAHPEKYLIIDRVDSSEQLQPGDILISTEHTMIFVGAQPEGFNTVDASIHDRVPGAENFFTDQSNPSWTVARLKR